MSCPGRRRLSGRAPCSKVLKLKFNLFFLSQLYISIHLFHLFRFLLLFAACLLSLLGKGLALASPFGVHNFPDEHKGPVMVTIIATMFLPGLLLGVGS